jgi:Tn3 transposase DDE domain
METQIDTVNARHSPEYFGLQKGVSAYTLVANPVPNIQRIMASLAQKDVTQATIVRKPARYARQNQTKKALWELENICRALHIRSRYGTNARASSPTRSSITTPCCCRGYMGKSRPQAIKRRRPLLKALLRRPGKASICLEVSNSPRRCQKSTLPLWSPAMPIQRAGARLRRGRKSRHWADFTISGDGQ